VRRTAFRYYAELLAITSLLILGAWNREALFWSSAGTINLDVLLLPILVVASVGGICFAALLLANSRDPNRFFLTWGSTLIFKFVAFAATVLWSLGASGEARQVALFVWIGAFLLISTHQVIWVVKFMDVSHPRVSPGKAPARG
jgi:hypothetical protein